MALAAERRDALYPASTTSNRPRLTPRLVISVFGREIIGYQAMGITGYLAGGTTGVSLAAATRRPMLPIVVVTFVAAAVFLAVVMATKLLTHNEYIVYFHHEIAILTASVVILFLFDAPLLPYMDFTLIGVLVFLGFGRIGCLMVGCCYGRPSGHGIAYGHRHVEAGFPGHLEGVTLIPVQAFESLVSFATATEGVHLVLTGAAGLALAWCVAAYGAARFFLLEPFRGDARPVAMNLSHAQWIAAARAAALLVAMRAHALPGSVAIIGLALTTVAAAFSRVVTGAAR
jgi:prolipoprotein diacylglyceryl transferase